MKNKEKSQSMINIPLKNEKGGVGESRPPLSSFYVRITLYPLSFLSTIALGIMACDYFNTDW
jgi:hypothetical protein